jgi:membrane-bound lytic murein transglycosylase D
MKLLFALFFAVPLMTAAQSPEVPHKMQFADLTLTIRDDARREIQKDVDAFTRYKNSFMVKVERARTYFPIIEKIFAEENVPDDFKYLVIQESALIPDAVSVSNAVGFWQFKDFTAIEMGLRVDKDIDERMNIVSASRAAARYLKKNNGFFDNWLYALQAYQMGAGGVMRSVKETKGGVKHMEITSNTYWYVKKYLAHKIAYEQFIRGEGEVKVMTYHTKNKKSLSDIAKEVEVAEEEVKAYNKWLKTSTIPDDKSYAVAIPVKGNATRVRIPAENTPAIADASKGLHDTAAKKGSITKNRDRIKINGIVAIQAQENETPTRLASRAGVDLSAFLKWNDISISDRLEKGQYFFLGKKRTRATTAYHKVGPGESLWAVSQRYGVQLKKLKRYNRLQREEEVKPGMTLWLASVKPKNDSGSPAERQAVVEVDDKEFGWDIKSPGNHGQQGEVVASVAAQKENVTSATPPAEEILVVEDTLAIQPLVTKETDVNGLAGEMVEAPEDNVSGERTPLVTESIEPPLKNQGTKKVEHVVQPKETLYGIARQYNVGVMDLVNWNNLDLQQGIKPGQVIRLTDPQPASETPQAGQKGVIEHEVKLSDTVYSIARKYGVTIKELMEWNNKKDFNLSVGEKLRVETK